MERIRYRLNNKEKSRNKINIFSIFYLKQTCMILFFLFPYFILSISMTFYQRWMLQVYHYPISVVVCHLVLKFVIALLCREICFCIGSTERIETDWKIYISKIAPIGIFSGLDIGLSNWGLELITISLYTMTKSTVIIFILFFSLLFKLEKKSWSLLGIVLMISLGIFLFTFKATQFNSPGFFLILLASFTSGLRWTLAQFIMQKTKIGLENPLDLLYHVQPWMIVSLLPFAIFFESKELATSCLIFNYNHSNIILHTILIITVGGLLAFIMELSEYLVVTKTSSLTLSVASIFKEMLTLTLGVKINGDQITVINFIGLLVCFGGIAFHIYYKFSSGYNLNTEETIIDLHDLSDDSENDNSFKRMKLVSKTTPNHQDQHLPLLTNSTSSDFIVQNFSDEETDEDSVLFDIVNRRMNPIDR